MPYQCLDCDFKIIVYSQEDGLKLRAHAIEHLTHLRPFIAELDVH